MTGEIPVIVLRWKFIDDKNIQLWRNSGLTLPSSIGELGESVTEIDLSNLNLRGTCGASPL
jgi:hypothetical protein